ncbi:hypothetical protein [Mesorhizobium neociceri]|uniref:Uncharacterized protein n=1 Tax=Mesorhizobium neociceri TaxID=1307853 RepID=A0A838B0N2_9HYPH|nr:hypothetical protein [Mesorhizobium neociceri]MBA1140398.1 hypothetical protein [Mesorhizobium neociceri]
MNKASKLSAVLASIFLSLFSLPDTATACATFHELDLNYMSNAQVIVRAKMTSYEPLFDPEIQERQRKFFETLSRNGNQQLAEELSGPSANSIRIKFKVVETISGFPRLDDWDANWVHSTFAMPEQWSGREDVIVGLRTGNDPWRYSRQPQTGDRCDLGAKP